GHPFPRTREDLHLIHLRRQGQGVEQAFYDAAAVDRGDDRPIDEHAGLEYVASPMEEAEVEQRPLDPLAGAVVGPPGPPLAPPNDVPGLAVLTEQLDLLDACRGLPAALAADELRRSRLQQPAVLVLEVGAHDVRGLADHGHAAAVQPHGAVAQGLD